MIAVCLTYELKNKLEKEGLLDHKTYKQILRILKHEKKVRINDGEWVPVKINKNQLEILNKLNIFPC